VRRHIEHDLHDGAQQRLVGLALLSSLATRTGRDDDADTIASGVAEARRELRELAAGDLPALLAERGLGTAISTLAATVPLDVHVQLGLPGSLPDTVAATAWFVVAESVANTVKHARATRLRIKGHVTGGVLSLWIEDDGVGGASVGRGTGLAGLHTRARDAGGKLRLDSPAGGGTTLHLEVPAAAP
jgi:signal transduction histidine kinase